MGLYIWLYAPLAIINSTCTCMFIRWRKRLLFTDDCHINTSLDSMDFLKTLTTFIYFSNFVEEGYVIASLARICQFQWNPSITDIIGTIKLVHVSLIRDHLTYMY